MTAVQGVMAEAFRLANRPTETAELSAALRAIEDPPGMKTDEMEQLLDTERRLRSRLAATAPITNTDLILKAEAAVRRLLKSIAGRRLDATPGRFEDGDHPEEIALGRAALRDLQASIRMRRGAEFGLPRKSLRQ